MSAKLDCYGLSDVGLERDTNEDQFLIAQLSKTLFVQQSSLSVADRERWFGGSQGYLFLVADGMGGHAAGERASTIAVDTAAFYFLNTMPWYFGLDTRHEEDLHEVLKAALENCESAIERSTESNPQRQGMGTTLTMGYLLWPRLYVVHAGDSRCYLLRESRLEQISRDHTVAQELVDSGVMPAEAAGKTRWSHMLWNVLGGKSEKVRPEVYKVQLEVGDTLLFCTDGLTRHIGDEDLVEFLGTTEPATATCEKLIASAKERGGKDNITAIVVRFLKLEAMDAPLEHAVESTAGAEAKLARDIPSTTRKEPVHRRQVNRGPPAVLRGRDQWFTLRDQ